jgi:hypothetical protein
MTCSDFSGLPGGGLTVLPAAVGVGDYDAYLAVVPGETLADIYIRHGSRLLEGNVQTFLGRRGNINRGIASTLAKEPARFFAYNNGIAATASAVTAVEGPGRTIVLIGATDLQIVNESQTTASLAALRREGKLPPSSVFVPMKLSVVRPDIAAELIPRISRFAKPDIVLHSLPQAVPPVGVTVGVAGARGHPHRRAPRRRPWGRRRPTDRRSRRRRGRSRIKAGNALMYYPEANVLVGRGVDPQSKTRHRPPRRCSNAGSIQAETTDSAGNIQAGAMRPVPDVV